MRKKTESRAGAPAGGRAEKPLGKQMGKQNGKPAEKGTEKQTGKQTEKRTEKQTGKLPERQMRKQGSRQVWRPGNMLYPLPAVMVSCALPGERPNIITVAWAGTVCSSPAMVSISVRPERYSYHIIRESGEFVINLTTQELVRAADYCGVRSGRDVDKFEQMHLTPLKASKVGAPLIGESPVNLECRVEQVLELGSHHMFLARVEAVDVDESYMDGKGKLQLNKAGLAVYSHGEYFALGKQLGTFGYSVKRRKI